MIDDRHRELGVVLSYLVGRPLRAADIADALGVSRSAYYLARDEGRLTTADNLLRLAAALGLNPVDLMLRYGLITDAEVVECAQGIEPQSTPVRDGGRRRTKRLTPRTDAPPI